MIRSPPGCPATLIEEPVLTRSASFPHLWLAVLFAFSTAARLLAQAPDADTGRLSLESLYHPTLRKPLVGGANTQLAWLSDGVLQLMRSNAQKGGVELLKVDPQSWETTPLLDESAVLGALQKAGVAEGAAKQALLGGGLVWNQQRSAFVVAVGGDLYYVDIAQADGRRLTRTEGDEDEVLFSPDGARVAFLRGNDLYVSAAVDGVETRLTTDGSGAVFNGRLDWVYQEELYGRGNWRGFWWSPDSQKIAYLQLDESKVPTFTVVDHRPVHQRLLTANYPKVGDPNPTAKLGVVGVSGGATQWMADPYSGQEILISNVGWAPDGRVLAQWQNRAQTWADLLVFDADGKPKSLLRETTKAWVERAGAMPVWLADGSFLFESDRDGFRHVYRHAADGSILNAVTAGKWDVVEVHGVDAKTSEIYFSAKERSPITTDVYKCGLDGKGLQRLTEEAGQHMNVRFSPDFSYFLGLWTDVDHPIQQHLRSGAGKLLRTIDANPSPGFKALKKGALTFQTVPASDGFPMESMLIKPPDFDPAKKYPVMTFLYGGPNAPMVKNAFTRNSLFYYLLAQDGYVVWQLDNRSASGKGWGSAWPIHKNLGELELKDQLDGLAWLKQQPWVDGSRIGIHGWSYGGYMTLVAMTRSDVFKCGISGAPVTDWRLYDTIYTERYMGLITENREGYEKSSVVSSAKNLSGKLLLIHGTLDDNVHPQNTLWFLDALHAAGKNCEVMLLPGSDHSPRALDDQWGVYSAMYDFIKRNL